MLVNYEPGLLELITPEVMLCVMGAVFISGSAEAAAQETKASEGEVKAEEAPAAETPVQ